jgi:Flp pilus assembly protein TadG
VSWINLFPKRLEPARGQSMVEYALGLSIAMLLIMGVVDLGRGFFAYNLVASTAREGARYAIVSSRTNAQIISYATSQAGVSGISVTVVSRGTAGNSSSPAVIQASSSFTAITPLISQICCGGGTITIAARSSMYVEN